MAELRPSSTKSEPMYVAYRLGSQSIRRSWMTTVLPAALASCRTWSQPAASSAARMMTSTSLSAMKLRKAGDLVLELVLRVIELQVDAQLGGLVLEGRGVGSAPAALRARLDEPDGEVLVGLRRSRRRGRRGRGGGGRGRRRGGRRRWRGRGSRGGAARHQDQGHRTDGQPRKQSRSRHGLVSVSGVWLKSRSAPGVDLHRPGCCERASDSHPALPRCGSGGP